VKWNVHHAGGRGLAVFGHSATGITQYDAVKQLRLAQNGF